MNNLMGVVIGTLSDGLVTAQKTMNGYLEKCSRIVKCLTDGSKLVEVGQPLEGRARQCHIILGEGMIRSNQSSSDFILLDSKLAVL